MQIVSLKRAPAETFSFRFAVGLAVFLTAAAAAGLVLLLALPDAMASLSDLPSNPWWFLYEEQGSAAPLGAPGALGAPVGALAALAPLAPLWRIASAVAAGGIGILAGFRAWALFRNSASPLLPFFIFFLLSLSLEGLRAGTAVLYAADGSIDAAIVLTRVVYWGRFVGLLSLLVAGLYAVDMKYRKFGMICGSLFLVSFAMSAYIPIDRTVFLSQLTWRLGDEQGVWFVNLIIGILVVATSAAGALTRRDQRFLWLAVGMALLLASREILFFAVNPFVLAGGLVCLAGGCVISLRALAAAYRGAGEKAQA